MPLLLRMLCLAFYCKVWVASLHRIATVTDTSSNHRPKEPQIGFEILWDFGRQIRLFEL